MMPPQDSPDSAAEMESLLPGFQTVLKINQTVRRLIVDYVLVAAILGLLPIYGSKLADILGFLALLLLNLKMVTHIRAHWGKPKFQGVGTLLGNLLNFLEAFAVGIVARLLVSVIGLFVPLVVVFNAGIGHAVLTWLIGRSAHQYYFNAASGNQASLSTLSRVRHLKRAKK
ncbi:MAG: hypothetical protein AAFY72_05980 [Cyanobacteria bacterium J06649_4]